MRRVSDRLALEKEVLGDIVEETQRELCKCQECAAMLKEARANLELLEDADAPSYYIRMAKAMLKQLLGRFK